MHAASVTLLCWAMIGAACFVSEGASALMAVGLAALVAFVGLPHGAADRRFARPRLEPTFGPWWGAVFLTGYVATASLVVLGWYAAPAATVVVFFLASAWHFGLEEPRFAIGPPAMRDVFDFARGGLVIWVAVAFQHEEVARILLVTSPVEAEVSIEAAMTILTYCSWCFLALASVAWGLQSLAAFASTGQRRSVLLSDNALVASMTLLFAVANPLISFLVYFCAWHSARGLRRLRRELGESWLQLGKSLAPMTAAAVVLIASLSVLLLRSTTVDGTLVRATFVGLSAVAIPHLLLHGVAPLFKEREARATQGVLSAGSPA